VKDPDTLVILSKAKDPKKIVILNEVKDPEKTCHPERSEGS